MIRSIVEGAGGYLPERVVANEELAKQVNTSDAWIFERTGIRQRHLAGPQDTAASMATRAAQAALAHAHAKPADVDVIILATSTPDQSFPATALAVQAALGCGGFGFDVSAACSGFIYGLSIADAMIRSGQVRTALVIGSEVYSRILDWSDRTTCVLFGDGAGAVFLRGLPQSGYTSPRGILSTHLHAQGDLGPLLYIDGAIGRPELSGYLRMNGREVFRHAVAKLAAVVEEAARPRGHNRRPSRQHLRGCSATCFGRGLACRPHQARPTPRSGGSRRRHDMGFGSPPPVAAPSQNRRAVRLCRHRVLGTVDSQGLCLTILTCRS